MKLGTSSFARLRSPDRISARLIPETALRYPGTSGSTHGDANDTTPTAKAAKMVVLVVDAARITGRRGRGRRRAGLRRHRTAPACAPRPRVRGGASAAVRTRARRQG